MGRFLRLGGVGAVALAVGSVLVLGGQSARAAVSGTLYVGEGNAACSDSGTGTQAVPFCTLPAAVSAAASGATIIVSAASSTQIVGQAVTFGPAQSGLTVEWSKSGIEPSFLTRGTAPMFTFNGTSNVTLSGFRVDSYTALSATGATIPNTGQDGVDIIGSQNITLASMDLLTEPGTNPSPMPTGVSIDGTSSGITVQQSIIEGFGADGIRAASGASNVTVTTNLIFSNQSSGGTPVVLNGVTSADVTSNTIESFCTGLAAATSTNLVAENNLVLPYAVKPTNAACPTSDSGAINVDAASAATAHADYNTIEPRFLSTTATYPWTAYSWNGTPYSSAADFTTATGQGAHDTVSIAGVVPAGESSVIDSADCDAPGELTVDGSGKPRVDDPVVPNTGNPSTCYADRGATETQDTVNVIGSNDSLTPTFDGVAAGALSPTGSVTATATINPPATSTFGYPVSYSISFGDGSASVPMQPGTVAGSLVATHAYTSVGRYQTDIVATDSNGVTRDGGLGFFYVVPANAPTSALSVQPGESATPMTPDSATLTVSWDASDLYPGAPTVNFGDGSAVYYPSGSGPATVQHVYPKAGTYTATFTATDYAGRVTTSQATVTVGDSLTVNTPVKQLLRTVVPAHGLVAVDTAVDTALNSSGYLQDPNGMMVDVTEWASQQSGSVLMYASDASRPSLATVQFHTGQAVQTTALATGGAYSTEYFYNNSSGSIHLEVDAVQEDVNGGAPAANVAQGDTFVPVPTASVLGESALTASHGVLVSVAGNYGVPANAAGVVLEVTALHGTAAGYVTAWAEKNSSQTRRNGTEWAKGQTVTSLLTLPSDGRVVLDDTSTGSVDLKAQVVGYYTAMTPATATFLPATAARLALVTIPGGQSVKVQVAGKDGVPAAGTSAALVNLTANAPTGPGALVTYADGTARPGTYASLSYSSGVTAEQQAAVAVGKDGAIDIYNTASKSVQVIVDLTGTFYAY